MLRAVTMSSTTSGGRSTPDVQRPPEGRDVGGRRVQAPVPCRRPGGAGRRCAAGRPRGSRWRRRTPRRSEEGAGAMPACRGPAGGQLLERPPAGPAGDEGQDDEGAVVVDAQRSPGFEDLRVPVEHRQVVLGRRQECGPAREGRDRWCRGRPPRRRSRRCPTRWVQQVLDRDPVVDQREVGPEDVAHPGLHPQDPSMTSCRTATAVRPLTALASRAGWRSSSARSRRRSARPNAASTSVVPSRSTRTTPENPVAAATDRTRAGRSGSEVSSPG